MAKPPPKPFCLLRGHEGAVTSLHFLTENSRGISYVPSLISGSSCGEIFIWNLQSQRTYHRLKVHDGKIISFVTYFNSSLISQGRDGLINIWKYEENEWNVSSSFKCSSLGFCTFNIMSYNEKSYLIASTGEEGSLTVYNYDTRTIIHSYNTRNSENTASSKCGEMCMCIKAFLQDSKMYIVIGYDSGYISLWDFDSMEEKARLHCYSEGGLICLDYDPIYKNRGICGSVDRVLETWKINENQHLVKVQPITIKNPGVNAVKIRSDGKIVIAAGQDHVIRIFSWKTLKPLAVLQFHSQSVSCLMDLTKPVSGYQSVFASGSKDKSICLWSIY